MFRRATMNTTEKITDDRLQWLHERPAEASIAMEMVDELTCSCCADLLVEPTTLDCGHTVCRLCLAHWYLLGKRECPQCRQVWQNNMVGNVNYTLRSTIEQLYPERLKQRITSLNDDPNNKAVIKQFDDALHRPTEVNPQLQLNMQALQHFNALFNPGNNQVDRQVNPAVEGRMKTLICYGGWGVMIAMLVIAVMLCAVLLSMAEMLSTKTTEGIKKPVHLWSHQDVMIWTDTLGPWTKEKLEATLIKNEIDGNSLLKLDETSLLNLKEGDENHEMLTDLETRLFFSSLRSLELTLGADPQTLWEFRDLHPIAVMIFFCLLYQNPRLVILGLGLLHYQQLFIPFVHVVSPVLPDIQHISLYTYTFPPLTNAQLVHVTVQGLSLPYTLFAQFIWGRLLTGHWFLASIFLINCGLMTVIDVNFFRKLYPSQNREIWMKMITAKAKHYFKELFFIRTAIYLTLYYYNFVPSFIYNLYFYFQFGNAILHPTVNIMPLFIDLLTPWIES